MCGARKRTRPSECCSLDVITKHLIISLLMIQNGLSAFCILNESFRILVCALCAQSRCHYYRARRISSNVQVSILKNSCVLLLQRLFLKTSLALHIVVSFIQIARAFLSFFQVAYCSEINRRSVQNRNQFVVEIYLIVFLIQSTNTEFAIRALGN